MRPEYLEYITYRTECCGLRLLYGIGGQLPLDVVYTTCVNIRDHREYRDGAHYAFTDNTGRDDDYGQQLKEFIEENNLGTVIETSFERNPNSGNQLKIFVWTPDREACINFADQHDRVPDRTLEDFGYTIGDFIRFTRNSPNRFEGRGRLGTVNIDRVQVTLQDGEVVNILLDELESCTKTRSF